MPGNKNSASENPIDRVKLVKTVVLRFILLLLILGLMLFWPAGTFRYWQAGAYIAILFIPMLGVLVYFLRKEPGILQRRMRIKEKGQEQNIKPQVCKGEGQ